MPQSIANRKSKIENTPLWSFAAAVVGTLAVLWVAAQLMSLFASAQAMTGPARIVAFVFAWAALALVVAVALWGLWLLRNLPDVPRVIAADFADNPEAFRKTLQRGYLSRLGDETEYVKRAGFSEKDSAEIASRIRRLRSQGATSAASALAGHATAADGQAYLDWPTAMRILQEKQDERAGEIINKAMGLIAVKTAASPWKIVDALAVFYVSAMMIFEIAKVYNRRTSKAGAFRLAGRWAFNIYVAREMSTAAESGVGVVTGAAGHLMKPNGISGAIASSLPLVGKIASKAVEGGANALFARSLGKRAIREFHSVEF